MADYFSTLPTPQFNSGLPGVPTTPQAPSGPNFQTISDLLSKPITPTYNGPTSTDLFSQGLARTAASPGLRPEIQQALDLIRARQQEDSASGQADASGLATRRGIAGSSTELFGVTQAQLAAQKAARDSESNILLANAQREQQLQDVASKALFDRANSVDSNANTAAQLDLQRRLQLGTLTSDEIASLRNMDFGNRQLNLESLLGQQGLDVQRQNIATSADQAKLGAQYGLYGAVGSALLPGLLFGTGRTGAQGGGIFSSLFGGGAGTGAVTGAPFNTASGTAGSTLFPSVTGANVGTGSAAVPGTAGAGIGFGGAAAIAGAGAGAAMLSKAAENRAGGGLKGSVAGVIANPIGSQLNFAKDLVSNPSATVNKIFGGGHHTDTKGSDAWAQNMDPIDYAKKLGTSGAYIPSYDSNVKGSAEANLNRAVASLTPEQIVARYSSGNPGTRTDADRQFKAVYDQVKTKVGRVPTPQEFQFAFNAKNAIGNVFSANV